MTQETAVEISDEVVEAARNAHAAILGYSLSSDRSYTEAMRAALQAAIPLVVDGFVPSEKIDSNNDRDPGMQNYRYGYNSCRRDFLAKVNK
jgi:hypothetical protein